MDNFSFCTFLIRWEPDSIKQKKTSFIRIVLGTDTLDTAQFVRLTCPESIFRVHVLFIPLNACRAAPLQLPTISLAALQFISAAGLPRNAAGRSAVVRSTGRAWPSRLEGWRLAQHSAIPAAAVRPLTEPSAAIPHRSGWPHLPEWSGFFQSGKLKAFWLYADCPVVFIFC